MTRNIRVSEETRQKLTKLRDENMLASHDAAIRFLLKQKQPANVIEVK